MDNGFLCNRGGKKTRESYYKFHHRSYVINVTIYKSSLKCCFRVMLLIQLTVKYLNPNQLILFLYQR